MEELISKMVSNVYWLLTLYPVATAAVSIFLGLMWCFFGYRGFSVLLVTTGIILGGLFGYAFTAAMTAAQMGWAVGAVVGAAISGVVFSVFVHVGAFLMGMSYATALALVMFRMLGQVSEHSAMFSALVVGLGGGLLALLLMRPLLVVYTSLTGTLWVVSTVVALVVAVPALEESSQLSQVFALNLKPFLMTFWPIIAGGMVILFGAGLTFQFTWEDDQPEAKSQESPRKSSKRAKAA